MIEALKSDDLVIKAGGRFKLCALIQRRLGELMEGSRPLIERHGRSDLEVAIEELRQDKIAPLFEAGGEAAGLPSGTGSKHESGALL